MLNAPINAVTAPNTGNPAGTAAPTSSATAGLFARQLERAAQDRDANAAPPPAAAPANAAKPGSETQKAEPGTPPPASTGHGADKTESKDKPASKEDDKHDDAASAAQPAPDLQSLLASLMQRPAPVATGAAAAAAAAAVAKAGNADATAAGPEAAGKAANGLKSAKDVAAVDLKAATDTVQALAPAAPDASGFALPQALPQGLLQAAALPQPEAVANTSAPYAAQVQAPVGSPDFAPGLSAQVSLMVRDGIQEARLQLNPAEMGPITVQIQVDGNTAQVTMTAEQAPTRDALEQAMPTLAGALREEGLTLTGGGVFEQSQQARDNNPSAPSSSSGRGIGSGSGDDGATAAITAAPRSTATRSAVDLYA